VDHGLRHIGGAVNDRAIRRNAVSRADKNYVHHANFRECNRLIFFAFYSSVGVREQGSGALIADH